MSVSAYYNEFDPKAAAWLRQLIKNGNITPGEVDERSITEINPDDLIGFDRVHFFAGIGTWDYCLNESGWGDRPIWTASLPCQPFSSAGKGLGKSDERHLLPHFLELVRQCKPDTIFGEQVEGAIKHGWLDDLQTNMEAEGYAIGHCVLGAHSIGAAHIRQRLYWVANSISEQREQQQNERSSSVFRTAVQSEECVSRPSDIRSTFDGGMVYANEPGSRQGIEATETARHGDSIESASCVNGMANTEIVIKQHQTELEGRSDIERCGTTGGMGNTEHNGHATDTLPASHVQPGTERRQDGADIPGEFTGTSGRDDATSLFGCEIGRGEWHNTDWLYCRDNKYRPVKSGIKPLVNGITRGMVHGSDPSEQINANETQEARVMRLKGYGNAIQAQTAMAFISAYMSILNG